MIRGFKPKGFIRGESKETQDMAKASFFFDRIGFLGVMKKLGFCDKRHNLKIFFVIKTLECLWTVCHIGIFQLLEGCDKGSKPSPYFSRISAKPGPTGVGIIENDNTLPLFEIVPRTLPLSLCERCSNII